MISFQILIDISILLRGICLTMCVLCYYKRCRKLFTITMFIHCWKMYVVGDELDGYLLILYLGRVSSLGNAIKFRNGKEEFCSENICHEW